MRRQPKLGIYIQSCPTCAKIIMKPPNMHQHMAVHLVLRCGLHGVDLSREASISPKGQRLRSTIGAVRTCNLGHHMTPPAAVDMSLAEPG